MDMSRKEKYTYFCYDPKDDEYFGCKKVIQREWECIKKRRKERNND
jgi:hypothetical protein